MKRAVIAFDYFNNHSPFFSETNHSEREVRYTEFNIKDSLCIGTLIAIHFLKFQISLVVIDFQQLPCTFSGTML